MGMGYDNWDTTRYGPQPTVTKHGEHEGEATMLVNCGNPECSAGQSVYVRTGEVCSVQTSALHAYQLGANPEAYMLFEVLLMMKKEALTTTVFAQYEQGITTVWLEALALLRMIYLR